MSRTHITLVRSYLWLITSHSASASSLCCWLLCSHPLSDSSASHPHTTTSFYPEPPSPILGHDPNTTTPRAETAQRKRPKYTRSKTGCLTCRVKKIKVSNKKSPIEAKEISLTFGTI